MLLGTTLEDHIGNLKNIMETHSKPWDHKNKEIPSLHPTPQKEK
jgi:hypothetical protein